MPGLTSASRVQPWQRLGVGVLAATLGWTLACVDPRRHLAVEQRFAAEAAVQGVAVDTLHVYVVADRRIEKYLRRSEERVAVWEAPTDAAIDHLNGGVAHEGRLYCAHSNYPAQPMQSSIEIFDTATLEHLGRHDLGRTDGSATWVVRHEGLWWVAFAHYAGVGGVPGRGPEHTRIASFDAEWAHVADYRLPAALIARLTPYSSSGGVFGRDGRLYVTGHHARELYVLERPAEGTTFTLREVLAAPFEGQGIALASDTGQIYGLARSTHEVIAARMP